jgi:hypothetical protein
MNEFHSAHSAHSAQIHAAGYTGQPHPQAQIEPSNGSFEPPVGLPAKAKKTREVEVITMEDGRNVEFVGARRMLKESFLPRQNDLGETIPAFVRLNFRNGRVLNFILPESLFTQFALHGAEQKLGDETAGIEDVDDMVLEVEELIDQLNKGEWSMVREGGGMSGTSVLLKALVELTSKSVEEMKAFLKAKSPKEKLALRASSKIKPTIDRIEAEKAAKNSHVNTDALLASVGLG